MIDRVGSQRGWHADAQQPDTGMVEREVVGAEVAQGLADRVECRSVAAMPIVACGGSSSMTSRPLAAP